MKTIYNINEPENQSVIHVNMQIKQEARQAYT